MSFCSGPGDSTADPPVLDVDDKRGQLALAVVTQLDYDFGKRTYTIEVTDPDADEAISTVRVTITVEDVNEAPSAPSELRGLPAPPPPANNAPEFDAATADRSVVEGTAAGENIGAAIMATDMDEDDTLTYSLSGTDAASFDIDDETGQIMTTAASAALAAGTYEVTVEADDGNGGTATIAVTITVTELGSAVGRYDTDNDGSISRVELVAAIRDLLFPADPANPVVTRAEVLELIRIHLFG